MSRRVRQEVTGMSSCAAAECRRTCFRIKHAAHFCFIGFTLVLLSVNQPKTVSKMLRHDEKKHKAGTLNISGEHIDLE